MRALMVMLIGCASPALHSSSSALTVSGDCADPAAFGAKPTPADAAVPTDARIGLQAALDAGGSICLPRGRWYVSKAPVGSYDRFAALSTHGSHVTIRGAGPETVLVLAGDQGKADVAVLSIDPGASDVTIADLTIDTSLATNTSEQTHAIAIGSGVGAIGPVEDVRISHVRFVHPDATDGSRKGDCIRILGNSATTAVRRVSIGDSTFARCARSGIGVQRNVHSLIIANNQFAPSAWDQAIDFEPTGDPKVDANDTTVISGNVFTDDRTAQGDFAVSLGGVGPIGRVVFTGNVLEGRGLTLYRVADTVIADNVINATMASSYGVINVQNVSQRLVIHHNAIHRTGAAGPLIRITPHSGGMPTDVTIDHNALLQDTAFHALYFESVSGLLVDHNQIRFGIPSPGMAAIFERATATSVETLTIDGNQIAGAMGYGVLLAASPMSFGAVTVTGNTAQGAAMGLYCTGTGGFAPAVVSYGNRMGKASCGSTAPGD